MKVWEIKKTRRSSYKLCLSHKVKMYLSVFTIIFIASLGAIVSAKIHSRELDLELHTQMVYASAPVKPYIEPGLNPNTSEVSQIKTLIRKVWGKDSGIGLAMARCESGYRADAKNHNTDNSWDLGVFQVNSVHDMPEMLEPVANIAYAYSLYIQQGTNPWTASEGCWNN